MMSLHSLKVRAGQEGVDDIEGELDEGGSREMEMHVNSREAEIGSLGQAG